MTYEYYKKAISFIQNKDTTVRNVFFFCEEEDIETVMVTVNLLIKDFHNLFFIRASNSLSDWEQMLLMSCCNHNIIANSSFSWWPAYLNNYPNKIVISPKMWSNLNSDLCDLIPPSWIQL